MCLIFSCTGVSQIELWKNLKIKNIIMKTKELSKQVQGKVLEKHQDLVKKKYLQIPLSTFKSIV